MLSCACVVECSRGTEACGGCGFHFFQKRLVDGSYDDDTGVLGSGCISLGSNDDLASVAGIRTRHSER